jgi:hypothetical protein
MYQQIPPTMADVVGLMNLGQHIEKFISIIGGGDEDMPRIKGYSDLLGQLQNHVKAMAQRLMESQGQQQQSSGNGEAELVAGKVKAMEIQATAKAQNTVKSHALKTAQSEAKFELEEQRKDKKLQADIRRENLDHAQSLARESATTAQELRHEALANMQELANNQKTEDQFRESETLRTRTAAKQAEKPPTSETE